MVDFIEVVLKRGLQSGLVEMDVRRDPLQMLFSPPLDALWPPAVSKQELAQPVTRLQLILPGSFARPHQITQSLMRLIRNPHRRQFSGTVATRQLLRIPAVRLHPITGFHRNQTRSDHLTIHSQLRQLPVQTRTRLAPLRR